MANETKIKALFDEIELMAMQIKERERQRKEGGIDPKESLRRAGLNITDADTVWRSSRALRKQLGYE